MDSPRIQLSLLCGSDASTATQLFRRDAGRSGARPARRGGKRRRLALSLLASPLLCLVGAGAAVPQVAPPQDMSAPASQPGASSHNPGDASSKPSSQDPFTQGVEHRMNERRNTDRQKMLMADTDKLLALAQQLKAEVDRTDKDQLSIDVVKRAEQIEKLARSVKEKMRGY